MGFLRTVTLAGVILAALPAAPAQAGGTRGPQPVDKYVVPAVTSGNAEWVKTWWTTLTDVCDVRVTFSAPGVTVTYPENTGTYASFLRSGNLAQRDVDYMGFKVTATADAPTGIELTTDLEYTNQPDGTLRPGSPQEMPCEGRRSHRTTVTRLLVLPTAAPTVPAAPIPPEPEEP
ncbi:hypothetical protein [Actinoplanes sp. NPDC051851]|uniref:hypothetical protein n=1 Tax=Actinoplanes sp. NPDC051851 TaxID=3154753 RepID=UPI003427826D